jgi:methanogenic corrinoid protein MtbC1
VRRQQAGFLTIRATDAQSGLRDPEELLPHGVHHSLPSGSQHELGALAFATAIRRRGLDVLYLGANVPVSSCETAVHSHAA